MSEPFEADEALDWLVAFLFTDSFLLGFFGRPTVFSFYFSILSFGNELDLAFWLTTGYFRSNLLSREVFRKGIRGAAFGFGA